MDAKQNSKTEMYRGVIAAGNANPLAWTTFTAFADPFAILTANVASIDIAVALQDTSSKGVTNDKNAKREVMFSGLLRTCAMMVIVGTVNNEPALVEQGKVTKTDLERAKDNAFIGIARRILDAANGISHLVRDPYGITGAVLTALSTQLSDFITAIPTPRLAEGQSKRGTRNLATLITDTDDLLENRLDPGARLLGETEPVFYNEYLLARKVTDPSYRTRALQVKVLSSTDATPLEKVDVLIGPGNLKKRTYLKGGFYVTNLEAGNYIATFSRPGFETRNIHFSITGGIRTDLEVTLVPAV